MGGDTFELARILGLVAISFVITILWTPALTHFLYKYNLGKRIRIGKNAPIFAKLHRHKEGTPTMGGVLIWGTTLFLVVIFWIISELFPDSPFSIFNFLNRGQTYLPLAALVAAAIIGLADDLLGIFPKGSFRGGLRMKHRAILYFLVAAVGAFWFFFRLDWDVLYIPFLGEYNIGFWYIPYFILVIFATSFSVNETDGLDGLAGGVLMMAFASYGVLAFIQGRFDLAALIGVIVGALLAFLWFNVPPARFFMGDTGAMSLGVALGIIAMLTNMSLLLPVIGLVLVIESASVILQVFSKKIFKKKIFISTPIHHHLQASGWPESKIVMRLWIVSAVSAGAGVIIGLVG
ncbi:MAG: phospho-N-acetylmuramoyl-pentapeptide-transferase [Candidatus Spechtbacterales bacterium]